MDKLFKNIGVLAILWLIYIPLDIAYQSFFTKWIDPAMVGIALAFLAISIARLFSNE